MIIIVIQQYIHMSKVASKFHFLGEVGKLEEINH